jgi:hypothetical protein
MTHDVQTESQHTVTLRFRPTFEELLAGVHVANSARRRLTHAIVVVALLGGLIGWATGFASGSSATLALVSAAYLLFQWLPPMRWLWPLLGRGPGIRPYLADDTVVILDGKGVHRTIGPMHRDVEWRSVSSIHEDARYIHLLQGSSFGTRWLLTIPKRSVTDVELDDVHAVFRLHALAGQGNH